MRKKSSGRINDELRPEYDFRALSVVARGPARRGPNETTVRLAPDVAETFPDSQSVNEALRFLIRITKGQIPQLPGAHMPNEALQPAAQKTRRG